MAKFRLAPSLTALSFVVGLPLIALGAPAEFPKFESQKAPSPSTAASKASTSTSGSSKAGSSKTAPAKTAPAKTAPAKTAPAKSATSEAAEAKPASADEPTSKAAQPVLPEHKPSGPKAQTAAPASAAKAAKPEQSTTPLPLEPPTQPLKAAELPAPNPKFRLPKRLSMPHRNPKPLAELVEADKGSATAKAEAKNGAKSEERKAPTERLVYLTFDDGPLRGTRELLEAVREMKVPVSFCMVGQQAVQPEYESLMREIAKEPLITLCNHSYTHASGRYQRFYTDPDNVLADMLKANEVLGIKDKIVHTRLPGRNVFRFPGMSRNDGGLRAHVTATEIKAYDKVAAAGFQLYGWDVEWRSAGSLPRESGNTLAKAIMNARDSGNTAIPGRVMVLAHDFMFRGRNAGSYYKSLVRSLLDNGYKFGRLEDYAVPAKSEKVADAKPAITTPHLERR